MGPAEMRKFKAGLRKNTRFKNINATCQEMELVLAVLRQNRSQLPKELVKRRDGAGSKGWRFSVLRPADPAKTGGGMRVCPACGLPASLRCSGCRAVYYCSEQCQRRAWAEHRRPCKKERKRKANAAAAS